MKNWIDLFIKYFKNYSHDYPSMSMGIIWKNGKYHTIITYNKKHIHSEMLLMNKISNKDKSNLIVITSIEPCVVCQSFLKHSLVFYLLPKYNYKRFYLWKGYENLIYISIKKFFKKMI